MQCALGSNSVPVQARAALPWAVPQAYFSSGVSAPALGATRAMRKDEEIFAAGQEATFFHKVVSGIVRTSMLLRDGRRQIDAFHLPGDIFGVEIGREHRSSAEAVGSVTVLAYRRQSFGPHAFDSSLGRDVVSAILRTLERAQDHMLLLGRKSPLEKISAFLLGFAVRLSGNDAVELPMSRADIADHLGLTIETVSRSLTKLESNGLIDLPSHRRIIFLRDRAALLRLNS